VHYVSTLYVNPETGALSATPEGDATPIHGIVPGVTGAVIVRCAVHRCHHEVGTISTASASAGLSTLEDFIRTTLAAVCPPCADWRQAWHETSVAFHRLRTDAHANVLTRPVDTMLAVGRALNRPRAFPDALEALASFPLPAEPPPLMLGGTFAVDPGGTILALAPGRRPAGKIAPLPRDKSWCLVCCQHHGWEHVSALAEPNGRARAALLDLGTVLIAQAVDTCDEFRVTLDVLHRELEALPVRDPRDALLRPARPMAAMRFYQDVAAAFSRATGDLGYVVARALEALG